VAVAAHIVGWLGSGAERTGRWQVAVETTTTCTALATAARVASADAARLCELSVQFYKITEALILMYH